MILYCVMVASWVRHGIINQDWFDNPIYCDCIKGQDSCEQGDALVEVLNEKFYKFIKARDFFESFELGCGKVYSGVGPGYKRVFFCNEAADSF